MGPWSTTANAPPFAAASTMLQLTDGRLFVQDEDAADWWFLTPDNTGSYANGSWSQAASMSEGRLYYASAVLKDGRVVVFGGEYITGGQEAEDNTGEVYDPATNAWTALTGLSTSFNNAIGDAPCAVLDDGTLLVGSIYTSESAIWNPGTNAWESTQYAKLDSSSTEESWVLQPNGSVLAVDNTGRTDESELFVPDAGAWVEGGQLPVALVEANCALDGSLSEEIGPALLMNDGRTMYFGGTGHTALYSSGSWTQGPDFPTDADGLHPVAKDTPAVLLPNGHLLVTAAPENPDGGQLECWGNSSFFFDVDPTVSPVTITAVAQPPGLTLTQPPYEGRMIILPTGETAFTQGTAAVFIYAAPTPDTSHAPVITSAPGFAQPGSTITLQGQRFNGMSQGAAYGDDDAEATNYPLVRFSGGGHVYYGKTKNFSTMGVATGSATVTTDVVIPATSVMPNGTYSMEVVANGVASAPATITVSTIMPPTVSLTSPTNGATVSGTVTANATASPASGTTLTGLSITIDGTSVASNTTSPLSYSWDTTTATNGTHAVVAAATDANAGAATSPTATVTVANNPKVSLTAPATGTSVAGSVAINATATPPLGTSIATFALTVDGAQVASSTSSPETFSWDTTTLANGSTHAIAATVTDSDGTAGSANASVTVKNLPTVFIGAPSNGASVGGTVQVRATATAPTGTTLSMLSISIDGAQVSTGSSSPQVFSWDSTKASNGTSHKIVATAVDADGTMATSSTVTVTTNNPTVSITAPAAASTVKGLVTVTATGAPSMGATLSTLVIAIDGSPVQNGPSSPQSYSWDTTKIPDGSHTIAATVTDSSSLSATQSISVTVKNSNGCGCGQAGDGTLALAGLGALAVALAKRRRRA